MNVPPIHPELLAGRVAVIVGNTYGIGRAAAALFLEAGAKVVWIDDKVGQEMLSSIRVGSTEIAYQHADLMDAASLKAAADRVAKLLPRVDILLNLAGKALKRTFENTTEDDWAEMIGRNLSSAFYCSRYFLPLMKQSTCGSIIHQGSIDGTLGNPSIAGYSAGKGGLVPLTHVMAHDLGKYGIRVNCISTGGIRPTPAPTSDLDRERISLTPLSRMGTPEDVARIALFLASDLASFVNGANIVCDGGRTGVTQGCYFD